MCYREREQRDRLRQYACTKDSSTCYVCYAFVNVKLNGVCKFARTFKIRGFDTCSERKSQGGGCRVSYGYTLKTFSSTRSSGFSHWKPRDTASVAGANWETEYEILKFSTNCEYTKFTGNESG
jgi:hypothetical protein